MSDPGFVEGYVRFTIIIEFEKSFPFLSVDSCKCGKLCNASCFIFKQIICSFQSPRFENFGSSRNSLNPECANSYHENPPNRILNRFFELNSVEKDAA